MTAPSRYGWILRGPRIRDKLILRSFVKANVLSLRLVPLGFSKEWQGVETLEPASPVTDVTDVTDVSL